MDLAEHLDETGVRKYLSNNKIPVLVGKTVGEIKEITFLNIDEAQKFSESWYS